VARSRQAQSDIAVIAKNPKARRDYHILDTWEAGLVLTGSEVKSLRAGKASLVEAYGRVTKGEVWLEGMHVPPYEAGGHFSHVPVRPRKLLLHRREINRLIGAVEQKGLALVPLMLYFRDGRVKLELGLGRGKKQHDRRDDIRRREAEREVARTVSRRT